MFFIVFSASLYLTVSSFHSSYSHNASKVSTAANEAVFCLQNNATDILRVKAFILYDNCYRCSWRSLVSSLRGAPANCTSVFADFGFQLYVAKETHKQQLLGTCDTAALPHGTREKSVLTVQFLSRAKCKFFLQGGDDWKYTPLLVAMGIMVAMAMFWIVWENFIFKYCKESRVWYQFFGAGLVVRSDLGSPDCEAISERLLSSSTSSRELKQATRRSKPLDAFRGLSLVVMIFVNYGGGGYWFFRLSYWNGLTVADLVFPWFVFILGVSAVISLSNSECHGVSRWSILLKVVRRFIILSVLGLFLNKSSDLATFRIPGVLQRLAVCYLMICLLHLCFSPRPDTTRRAPSRFSICEIRYYLIQWFLALDLVLGYVLITYLVHKSDCPDQYLGPGGKLGDGGKYMNANCTGGAAGYIDELVFSHDHIYQTPTCKKMYETGPYDPEGMLGTLTSIFLSFLGVHAGRIFLLYRDKHQRMIRWTVNGIVFGISGAGLCCFQQNGGLIPINKNLWSVSYTLVMAGISFILLTIFYYVIDIKKWWTGAPFYFLGMNSILVYVGHRMVKGYFPFDWESDLTYVHLMIRNVTGTVLWVAIAAYLHYIKLFVKV